MVIDVDGVEVTRRLQPGGVLSIPPTTGRRLTLTFTHIPGPRKPGLGASRARGGGAARAARSVGTDERRGRLR